MPAVSAEDCFEKESESESEREGKGESEGESECESERRWSVCPLPAVIPPQKHGERLGANLAVWFENWALCGECYQVVECRVGRICERGIRQRTYSRAKRGGQLLKIPASRSVCTVATAAATATAATAATGTAAVGTAAVS
jgi:hypothetical protein